MCRVAVLLRVVNGNDNAPNKQEQMAAVSLRARSKMAAIQADQQRRADAPLANGSAVVTLEEAELIRRATASEATVWPRRLAVQIG